MTTNAPPTDLTDRFGDAVTLAADGAWEIAVDSENLHDALAYLGLEREPPFNFFSDLFAVDDGEEFEVIYHATRGGSGELVRVRARLPRQGATVPTVTDIWVGASWPEREMMEMYGIAVEGHPDPRNLLLPEGWKGHPLRKDYEYPEDHPWLSRDPLHEDPDKYLAEHPVEDSV